MDYQDLEHLQNFALGMQLSASGRLNDSANQDTNQIFNREMHNSNFQFPFWHYLATEIQCYILKQLLKDIIKNGVTFPGLIKQIRQINSVSKSMIELMLTVLESSFSLENICELSAFETAIISQFALARLLLSRHNCQKFKNRYLTSIQADLALTMGRSIFDSFEVEPVKELLKKGADIDKLISVIGGRFAGLSGTPLMLAIVNKRIRICSLLIEAGADVNKKNETGKSALDLAIRLQNKALILELLEAGAIPSDDIVSSISIFLNQKCSII